MTLNQYQSLALRTAPTDVTHFHDLQHAAMGMVTEAAEFMNVLKKQHAYGKPLDFVNLKEEVGDQLWFCALAARALGTSLEELADLNIRKLQTRFPSRFTAEQAIERDTVAERIVLETTHAGEVFVTVTKEPKSQITPIPTPIGVPVAHGTEALVCQDIAKRQAHGMQKYGVSVQDNPLPFEKWLQHAYEEFLDAAVYMKRSMEKIKEERNVTST